MLFDHALPGESATKTAIREATTPDELAAYRGARQGHGPWSHTELLLADVIDTLRGVIYAVYRSQGADPAKPEPYPRPGIGGSKRRARNPHAAAIIAKIAQEHADLHNYDVATGAPLHAVPDLKPDAETG